MEAKEQVLEMYKDATRRLDKAMNDIEWSERGTEERDIFERIYGERQAYGRILKEIFGVNPADLQRILDEYHTRKRLQG